MPAVAALAADPQLARLQGNVVENHDDLLCRQLVKPHGLRHRLAAQVHKGLGLHQQHPPASQHGVGAQGFIFQPVEPHAAASGDLVQHQKTGVVPGIFIFSARIA